MPFGWPELLIVLVIVLLVLGPKRLPSLGRQLGGGMREFKDSVTARGDRDDEHDDDDERPAQLERGSAADPLDPTPDATRTPTGARDASATRAGRDPRES